MGHMVNPAREYRLLQRRLDRNVTGAPDSPTFTKILEMLFAPEEAAMARHMPSRPTALDKLAKRLDMPLDELDAKISDMGRRGLVIDFAHRGRRYALLAPIVIGFFEFTFMRVRDDIPMKDLSALFEQYMTENDRFAKAIFSGETQIGRSLAHEEALPEDDPTEILDWERASRLVDSATAVAVSHCACRHKLSHLGEACDAPLRNCLTLNFSAEYIVRHGIGEPISNEEGLRILEEAKAAGLAQTGDNVQQNVGYICNCCGCCCGMMMAIRKFNLSNAIVTSNFIAQADPETCNGCGLCAKACPIDAIAVACEDAGGEKRVKFAEVDRDLCLGCGVCYSACKRGAMRLEPREKRVYTPENVFDRVVAMAIERGKLANVVFDEPEQLSHRALRRLLNLLENTPPVKAALAVKPLRSAFLNHFVAMGKKRTGAVSTEL